MHGGYVKTLMSIFPEIGLRVENFNTLPSMPIAIIILYYYLISFLKSDIGKMCVTEGDFFSNMRKKTILIQTWLQTGIMLPKRNYLLKRYVSIISIIVLVIIN
jgi:hypothetical protein